MKVFALLISLVPCLSAQGTYLFDTARALYAAAQYPAALAKLEASEVAGEAAPLRPLYLAMCFGQMGSWEKVDPLLDPFLKSHPDAEEGWYWKGAAGFHERQFASAHESFQHAVTLAPKDSDAWRMLGLTELELDRRNEAHRAWLKAVEVNPRDPKAYYLIGRLFYESNRYNESLGWLSKALTLDPRDFAAITYLGLSYESLGKNDEATRCYRAAIKESLAAHKPYAWAYSSLGKLLRKTGAEQESRKVLEDGARLCPEAQLLTAWGQALLDQKDKVRAEQAFRRAIAMEPALPGAHYLLARLLAATNRPREGKAELQMFQRLKEAAEKRKVTTTVSKTGR